jgi:uncharacterized RDD family membrane protein YckC
MTQKISILTPEHVELDFELAGLGSRFIAVLLDGLIRTGVILVLLLIYFAAVQGSYTALESKLENPSGLMVAIGLMAFFLFTTCYFMFFEIRYNGQTPGKMVAGIRVILDSGHPIDFRAGLIRNLLRTIDGLPALYTVGSLFVFFSQQHRRIGDYAAGTLIVKVRRNADVEAHVQEAEASTEDDSEDGTTPTLSAEAMPFITSLTAQDYRALRYFLDRYRDLGASVAGSITAQMAEPIANKLHIEPEKIGDPLLFLQAVCAEWERRKMR